MIHGTKWKLIDPLKQLMVLGLECEKVLLPVKGSGLEEPMLLNTRLGLCSLNPYAAETYTEN